MKVAIAAAVAVALFVWAAPDTMAQGKKTGAAKTECLNPIVCGPQPVKQIRKPKNERFMRSAS
jgi:hypothetical protein